jgi:tetraacyldisaccharide 4'-kinase
MIRNLSFLLWPLKNSAGLLLGGLYSAIVRLRAFLYTKGILTSHTLTGMTISVGNLEVGGTGKSPIVVAIAEYLRELGYQPAILTRGYRSGLASQDSMVLKGGDVIMPPLKHGIYHADESTMQAQQLENIPVIVGANRYRAANRYLSQFPAPTHWILDDGFQHLKLKRQVNIVLIDANSPPSAGKLLPRGTLREPPSALRRASLVLFTRAKNDFRPDPVTLKMLTDLKLSYGAIAFKNSAPTRVHGPDLSYAKCTKVAVMTAIAKPRQILEYPLSRKQIVSHKIVKSDHSRFSIDEVVQASRRSDAILTTAKDYYRDADIFAHATSPVFILPLHVTIPRELLKKLLTLPPK